MGKGERGGNEAAEAPRQNRDGGVSRETREKKVWLVIGAEVENLKVNVNCCCCQVKPNDSFVKGFSFHFYFIAELYRIKKCFEIKFIFAQLYRSSTQYLPLATFSRLTHARVIAACRRFRSCRASLALNYVLTLRFDFFERSMFCHSCRWF